MRVAKYEDVYEPMTEEDLSYIKLYNVGQKVCACVLMHAQSLVNAHLSTLNLSLLMCTHTLL